MKTKEESKLFHVLASKLSKCDTCGPTIFCKLDRKGTHHALSNVGVKAWASALARHASDVDLENPPKCAHFDWWFDVPPRIGKLSSAKLAPNTPDSNAAVTALLMQNNLMMSDWMSKSSPTKHSTSQHAAPFTMMQSSDPPDVGFNPYPSIDDFFLQMHNSDPKIQAKNLPTLAGYFTDDSYCTIDEIKKMSSEEMQKRYLIKPGAADYIEKHVKAEVKRIQRNNG